MRAFLLLIAVCAFGQEAAPVASPPKARVALSLAQVKRVFVAPLAGGSSAGAMREMLIASLNSTGLFVMTDDQNRADAILKGAADDKIFVDAFDSDKSLSARTDGGMYGGSRNAKSGGGYAASSGADREAYHIRDRKHEAYAAIRLVNRAGDTLWSTTQESMGSKFRSAGADVGEKVARQVSLDMEHASRSRADVTQP